MIRALHRWPGLVLAVLLTVTAVSGAALSVFPAIEAAGAPPAAGGLTTAELAARVQAAHPGLEQIKRSATGRITAWWFDGGRPGSAVVDPATGRDLGSADPDPRRRWLTTLHRSLFLDDAGRLATAAGALAMLALSISGALLVARRVGGWRRWFARLRGPRAGRLHTEIARVAVAGLALSSATGLWMAAQTLELVVVEPTVVGAAPRASGRAPRSPAAMPALRATPLDELRELSFPAADDPREPYTLKTVRGVGHVDAGTGERLDWRDAGFAQRASQTVEMLHTGQGAAVLGLVLGLAALGVPALAVTGTLVWLGARRARPKLARNDPAADAEAIVLVGSEGGSTWGFAATLADALRAAGRTVHVAPMNAFAPARCRRARCWLILAATYGDGAAPASADGFLERLARLDAPPAAPLAVLGFGDRHFPAYCAFAQSVDAAARARGWSALLPLDTVNRQSPQDFARWGRTLGAALGVALALDHRPPTPAAQSLALVSRRDHGQAVDAPTSILRFALPKTSAWDRLVGRGFARFEPGDLLGVVPEGSTLPRMYSLASGSADGFVEVVVRRHPGGLCSGQLTRLAPGQTARAFVRRNPAFRAGAGRAPLILVGAGTGVGPLAGFVRRNGARRPIHLFFGLREPSSDFLYRDELARWQADGRLAGLSLAVSRGAPRQHVQDALGEHGAELADAIARRGARVMVCGGRDMARGVADALTTILAPAGLSPAILKAADRYAEDVY